MREMKDSGDNWIGAIPIDWDVKRLKNVVLSMSKGNGITRDEVIINGDTPCVRYGEIYSKYDNRFTKCISATNVGLVPSPQYFGYGDILCAATGELVEEIGKGVVYLGEDHCLAGGDIIVIHHNQIPSFLNYSLNCHCSQAQKSCNKTKLKVVHISASDIGSVSIALPSLSEQQVIAEFLDRKCADIDNVLERTKASIEEYKKLKQSVITEAVTKGIRSDRPMKDSGIEWIGRIAKDFHVWRMKHLLSSPLQYGASESGIPYEEHLPRYIRITDITAEGKLKESGRLSLTEESAQGFILSNDDILFARSGATVGKAFQYKVQYGKCAFAGYLIKAVFDQQMILPAYVFYYTQSSLYEEWKNQIFVQATIQNIGADKYYELPIVKPNVAEQQEIVSYLDLKCAEIDSLIASKEKFIAELESYKKSLIYEYVTGKKEVPSNA